MGFLEEREFSEVPAIPDYYRGKTIFVTGGSGFMGKVLVEKLLYSCTELDRIYLLLRNKKDVKSEDRLQAIYSSPCFDRLRRARPGAFHSKVFVMSGDVGEVALGLSEEDRALLLNRVNIIFHVAASVRFDDPLEVAARLNLRGTRELVELANEARFLELENCVKVSEIVKKPSGAGARVHVVREHQQEPDRRGDVPAARGLEGHLEDLRGDGRALPAGPHAKIPGELPNTYTFTKQLAEHVVYEHRGKLPAVIMRPSIVISSHKEPLPGWIENFNGPVGILVASGKGIMRSLYSDPELVADYMPVDIAIRCFIAAAWARGTAPLSPADDIPVYNCCAGSLNTITIGRLVELGKKVILQTPLNDTLWRVGGSVTTSFSIYYVKVLLLHLLPALLVDALLWLLGRKPMLVKVQRRIYMANIALRYYLTQQWTFSNQNIVKLRSRLKEEDREQFYYDMEGIDQYEFFLASGGGARRYLLKETDEDLPRARAHYQRMIIVDVVVKCLFYGFVLWRLYRASFAKDVLQSVYNMFRE